MNRTTILKLTLAILAVIWLFVVTFNYYVVHKPFAVENALAILNALGDVIVAGVLVALATALGRRLTRTFAFAAPLEASVLRAGLGLGMLSLATLALGFAGLLHRILFWLLLVAATFLLRNDLLSAWRDLRAVQLPMAARFERALAVFTIASLILAFLFALTPPIAWDAQTYQLVIPKVAIERGRIVPPPDIPYFSFPSLVNMLFLAAMILKGDIAAQALHFVYLLLTLGALFAFANRHFSSLVAWLSVAILVAVPSFMLVATWAYVDVALAFYAFAAYCVLRLACQSEDKRWFVLAGMFAGFAMGVKYTAVIVPVAVIGVLVIGNGSLIKRSWSLVIWFLGFGILFAMPWYLRNLVFAGNPVYPFFFGGPYWDAFRANWFGRFGTGLLNTPLQLLTAPWDATIYGQEGALGYEATIGPLLLVLLPLLLLRIQNSKSIIHNSDAELQTTNYELRITNSELRSLLLFSLILYLFWLLGVAQSKLLLQTRLLFAAFPTLALAAAVAFDRLRPLDLPQFSLQRFARLVIALVFALTLSSYALAFASNSLLAYLVGAESRADYLARTLGAYDRAAQFIAKQLPADARILALWEPRSYYIQRAIQPDAILDQFPYLLAQTRDADAIARRWQSEGYTHVLLNRQGLNAMLTSQYDPVSLDDVRVLQQVLARHAQAIHGEPLEIVNGAIKNADAAPYVLYALR
jgi:hypothetical protein